MNVLGKIKSKKAKIEQQNEVKQQKNVQKQQLKKIQEISNQIDDVKPTFNEQKQQKVIKPQNQTFLTQQNKQKSIIPTKFQQSKKIISLQTQQRLQYIPNTNVITKQKLKKIRQPEINQDSNTNSFSNGLSTYYQTKKQSKKPTVHYDQNPSLRADNMFSNANIKPRLPYESNSSMVQPLESQTVTDQDFQMDFTFLLSHKQKKEIKKSIHLSKGKVQNIKEIQASLIEQNNQVLCFYIKKWNFFGNIYMFQGEIESLKRRFVQIEIDGKVKKVYDKVKTKVSCLKDIITSPQSIGRMYLSNIVFLTQNQAMINLQFLLQTVQKSRRFKRR